MTYQAYQMYAASICLDCFRSEGGEEREAPLIAPFPAKLEKGDAFHKLKLLVWRKPY